MPRSNDGHLLRQFQADAAISQTSAVPLDEIRDHVREIRRRQFLTGSLGLGAAFILSAAGCSSSPSSAPSNTTSTTPSIGPDSASQLRVAVVGAGLAGLTCAYRLASAGADVSVYEASERIGGRARTVRDFFGDNRTAESGAEAVNSDHRAIRGLLDELGLGLDDLYSGYPDGASGVMSFDGRPYKRLEALNDWREIADAVKRDFAAAGADTRWDTHTDAALALDQLSVAEWVEANVPGGRSSRLGRLIEITQEGEWAGAAEDQSALLFLDMVGSATGGDVEFLGDSDERWHIKGGSDHLATRLGAELTPGTIQLGSALVAARGNGEGVRCSFEQSGTVTDIDADRLVLALPFSVLRTVDLAGLELTDRKRRVIDEQPIGSNSKLHLEFASRAWRTDGADGDSTSDTGLMTTWEEVITEPGPTGVMVAFTGGARGAAYDFGPAHGEAPASVVADTGPDLETVFGPATRAATTGRGWLDSWVDDPLAHGSYSYWGVGQETELRGAGGVPEGPVHFCGEHTSLEYQGFMNGAVETGERAAGEILNA